MKTLMPYLIPLLLISCATPGDIECSYYHIGSTWDEEGNHKVIKVPEKDCEDEVGKGWPHE